MKRFTCSVTALMLVTTMAGCATVTSKYVGEGAPLVAAGTPDVPPAEAGLNYFLPRQLAKVTATRTSIKLDDAVKALLSAQSALEEAKAKVPEVQALIHKTEDLLADPEATEEGKKIQQSRLKALETQLADARSDVDDKKTALETAKVKVGAAAVELKALSELKNAEAAEALTRGEITKTTAQIAKIEAALAKDGVKQDTTALKTTLQTLQAQLEKDGKLVDEKKKALALKTDGKTTPDNGSDTYKVTLKVELLPPSADPAQAFRLSPRHTVFRDDEQKLAISSNGLLTSTDITATDRTGEVIVELATGAGALSGLGGKVKSNRPDETKPKACPVETGEYTGVIDFTNATALGVLNDDILCMGVRLTAEGKYWPATSRPEVQQAKTFYAAIEGIVYRTPIEVQVRVEKCTEPLGACGNAASNWRTAEVMTLSLPQAGPISYLRQDAGFLTKVKYDVAFKDGIPVNYASSRPSELLAGARVPMQLINGFFGGVSKVISLRTGVNNDKAAFATSQLALLNSQIALQAGGITGQKTLTDAELAALQSQIALQVGALDGKTRLSAAELALLQQQLAGQVAPIQAQGTLAAAQLAALQQQYLLQAGGLAGETSLTNADLARLQAQTTLFSAQNTAASQRSALELALRLALLRDQAKHDALNRCIAEKMQAGLTVDSCLTDL
jgi:hypothetical protein